MIELLVKIGVPKNYAGDIWVLILFLVASFVLVALVKKKNLGALLISVYVAYAIAVKAFFAFLDNQNFKLAFFAMLIFFLFQLFQRFFKMAIGGGSIAMWSKVVAVSLSIVGLLSSIAMKWLPPETVSEFFSPLFSKLFLSNQAQFVWMTIPLVLIFVLAGRRH